jgi:hypothetical protein
MSRSNVATRRDAKLPLEAKPDVDEHRGKREHSREQAVAEQFAADPGADDVDPPDLDIRQRLGDASRDDPLGVLDLLLIGETHENISRGAELLYAEIARVERCEGLADHIGLQRLCAAQLDGDAAAKINPEVQARIEKEGDGKDAEDRRCNDTREATAHELNSSAVGD